MLQDASFSCVRVNVCCLHIALCTRPASTGMFALRQPLHPRQHEDAAYARLSLSSVEPDHTPNHPFVGALVRAEREEDVFKKEKSREKRELKVF